MGLTVVQMIPAKSNTAKFAVLKSKLKIYKSLIFEASILSVLGRDLSDLRSKNLINNLMTLVSISTVLVIGITEHCVGNIVSNPRKFY